MCWTIQGPDDKSRRFEDEMRWVGLGGECGAMIKAQTADKLGARLHSSQVHHKLRCRYGAVAAGGARDGL